MRKGLTDYFIFIFYSFYVIILLGSLTIQGCSYLKEEHCLVIEKIRKFLKSQCILLSIDENEDELCINR